jgi:hypothetical protein
MVLGQSARGVLRFSSEVSNNGVENSVIGNRVFVVEVVVFSGFSINVKPFYCV